MSLVKNISSQRFRLYTMGTRRLTTNFLSEELRYWSDHSERLIGLVNRDKIDSDFGWVLLARDRVGRFRAIECDASFPTPGAAKKALKRRIAHHVRRSDLQRIGLQGDEQVRLLHLMDRETGVNDDALHPYFRVLAESEARMPARSVISEMSCWIETQDAHFRREFQTSSFDQRLWELYLWAALRELGFEVEWGTAPDFMCDDGLAKFSIEATTVGPSLSGPLAARPRPRNYSEMRDFLENYMPIKYGSALRTKMMKVDRTGRKYWQRSEIKDLPFVIAIADFHQGVVDREVGSMTYTQAALWEYLYGARVRWDENEKIVRYTKLERHSFGNKNIQSGFFSLPEAQNISAVLFSNAGTLAKFDRMGVGAGFRPSGHRYLRVGERWNPDPEAITGVPFSEDVSDSAYSENWADELQVFHNPNASIPLSIDHIDGIAQYSWDGDQLLLRNHSRHVLHSYTLIQIPQGGNVPRDAAPRARSSGFGGATGNKRR